MSYSNKEAPLLFGYLVELNHALFNLFGMPLFIFLAHSTFDAAEAGFQQLSSGDRLKREGSTDRAFRWIRSSNRRIFRIWMWVSVILAALVVLPAETLSFNKGNFGWVQSVFAPKWSNASLAELGMKTIPYAVTEPLGLTNATAATTALGSIRINNIHGGTFSSEQRRLFYLFLVVSLGFQIFFFAIGFWVVGKLIFILYLLFQGFSNADQDKSHGLRLNLNFRDKGKRFGLRVFDTVYDNALGMIAVGSLAFTLQQLSNTAKGTMFGVFERAPFYGHLVGLLIAAGLFALVMLFPGLFFMRHAVAARNRESNRLESEIVRLRGKLKAANTSEDVKAIKEEIDSSEADLDVTQQQSPWPSDDWWFRGLLVLILAFLFLIPLGLMETAGSWAKPLVDFCSQKLPLCLKHFEEILEKILPGL
jgi:hypothetical protein